ncbi:MAG: serine protease, partial [Acidobacteria bacterium]|nr:serine protease [Acidobacteriota bacterium]
MTLSKLWRINNMQKILFGLILFLLPTFLFAQSPAGFVANYNAYVECSEENCLAEIPIEFEGASFIKVHLKELFLPEGATLEFWSGEKQKRYFAFSGPFSGSLYLPSLPGERCFLNLVGEGAKLQIDKVGIGFEEKENKIPERICGNDDRLDPSCYDNSYRGAGEKVGRIMFEIDNLLYYCTGFLVSADGLFVTNQHCIQNEAAADSAEVWWKYENSTCGGSNAVYDSVSSSAELIVKDPGTDISILKFKYDNPASRYGFLQLDDRKLEKGETIWIPQHPLGGPKKFAVHSDSDGGATILEVGLKGVRVNQAIGYNLDAEAGSSGSPVLDSNNKVVAVHTFSAEGEDCKDPDLNKGIKMQYLYPIIYPYLVSCNGNPPHITRIRYNAKSRRFKLKGDGFMDDSVILVNGVAQSTHYKNDGSISCAMFDRIWRGDTVSIEVFTTQSGCKSDK